MKQAVEKRKPKGFLDHIALALTTFGVGYIPGAPGTYGSVIAVAIYLAVSFVISLALASVAHFSEPVWPFLSAYPTYGVPKSAFALMRAAVLITLVFFSLVGIWASNRSIPFLGNEDPPEAVVDEVMGQLVTFLFVPFAVSWPFILAGFLLFRLFDIWKPYPIRNLEILPGGLGICADDIVAGVYAGICLSVGYAIYLTL
jgi:phosphatidylglycerophosphatase A